jgi:hypothetical protein
MSIKCTYDPIEKDQKYLTLKFLNDDGLEFTKVINVPYNSNEKINESYLTEIIEAQIRSVEYKLSIGAVEFQSPVPKNSYTPPK